MMMTCKRGKSVRQNELKRKLAAGDTVLGVFVGYDCPPLVEVLGYTGFDYVLFDGEHGTLDPHDLENMVRAAETSDVTPLARITQNTPQTILRNLDVGVQGVMVPWCQSAAEARAAVQAAKYYPEGRRGLAGVRAARYGVGMKLTDYVARANDETMVIVQIETVASVDALPEMLQVPGVDVFFIGPNDLSQSVGYPGRPEEPAVQEVIDRATGLILGAGKTAGIMVRDAASLRKYRDQGARFIAIGFTSVLAPAARALVAAVKD
jgi:4-hydroxy-2-oxoheptanedioate aldolase